VNVDLIVRNLFDMEVCLVNGMEAAVSVVCTSEGRVFRYKFHKLVMTLLTPLITSTQLSSKKRKSYEY
jgi:hypothetical protein